MNKGTVVQIIGAVVDVKFDNVLPAIENALEIKFPDGKTLVAEVAAQLGDNIVRAVALSSTDGLARGAEVIDTGAPLQVPVGEACLGRLMNVLDLKAATSTPAFLFAELNGAPIVAMSTFPKPTWNR